jgi:hypothetical protein
MKIWNSYGSEHSMALVMIGRFQELVDAQHAEAFINQLTRQVNAELESESDGGDDTRQRFSDAVVELFRSAGIYSLSPQDVQELRSDVHVERKGSEIVVTTDECEVAVFLKIMLAKKARIEVYSAHDYPHAGGTDESHQT